VCKILCRMPEITGRLDVLGNTLLDLSMPV